MIPVIIAIFCNFHSIVFLLPYSFPPAEAPPNPRPSPPPFGDWSKTLAIKIIPSRISPIRSRVFILFLLEKIKNNLLVTIWIYFRNASRKKSSCQVESKHLYFLEIGNQNMLTLCRTFLKRLTQLFWWKIFNLINLLSLWNKGITWGSVIYNLINLSV